MLSRMVQPDGEVVYRQAKILSNTSGILAIEIDALEQFKVVRPGTKTRPCPGQCGGRADHWLPFLYNAAGIPIAAGVLYPITGTLLSPMIAGAAMSVS